MNYTAELSFLKNALSKMYISCNQIDINSKLENENSDILDSFFLNQKISDKSIKELFSDISPNVIYRISTSICKYIFFLLPPSNEQILVIGPYTLNEINRNDILEKAESLSFEVDKAKRFEQFYQTVPYIANESYVFALINSFAETIWEGDNFHLEDVDNETYFYFQDVCDDYDDNTPLINMRMMEERYHHEQELMDAISHGQSHKAALLKGAFSKLSFESRIADPLRNMKNYCIITNTLFRKAAQNGGVHPIYLDGVSSDYAKKIEQLAAPSLAADLILDMFSSYCNLVRKKATDKFSPLIQKVIIMIDSDLTTPLSLSDIADKNNVSAPYLSAAFKKETGKTITEFVLERRIKYAKKLLKSTNLQIQTIAAHCGILDVHYFTKLFKKYEGITPKQYREK